MIAPDQLTKENGFEDGVVFSFFVDGKVILNHWSIGCLTWGIIERAEWIKVLTGPMAIWNFAPPFATHCQIWPLTLEVQWHGPNSEIKTVGKVTKRPFWARIEE